MLLHYHYHGKQFHLIADWTDLSGQSIIHRQVVENLISRHGPNFSQYQVLAQALDEKADELFALIYTFIDEHYAIPYDAKFRNQFIRAYANICELLEIGICADASEQGQTLTGLFFFVSNQLRQIVDIYLLDNAYQGKYGRNLYRYPLAGGCCELGLVPADGIMTLAATGVSGYSRIGGEPRNGPAVLIIRYTA